MVRQAQALEQVTNLQTIRVVLQQRLSHLQPAHSVIPQGNAVLALIAAEIRQTILQLSTLRVMGAHNVVNMLKKFFGVRPFRRFPVTDSTG